MEWELIKDYGPWVFLVVFLIERFLPWLRHRDEQRFSAEQAEEQSAEQRHQEFFRLLRERDTEFIRVQREFSTLVAGCSETLRVVAERLAMMDARDERFISLLAGLENDMQTVKMLSRFSGSDPDPEK